MRVDSLCGVWLNNRKRVNDLMQMLFLNEASGKLTMQSVLEDYHVLRRALEFKVDAQRKKGRTDI